MAKSSGTPAIFGENSCLRIRFAVTPRASSSASGMRSNVVCDTTSPPLVARSITLAAMLTSTPSQSEPIRCGLPVWMPARIRGVYPSMSTVFTASSAATTADTAVEGSENTAMTPSPIRLTMRPPVASSGGSITWATRRNRRSVVSSPAASDHSEKPTRSVNTSVTSGFAGRPDTRSVSACHTCNPARLTSRDAASWSSNRPAARAAARGPPTPAADSGSPKSGSPGSALRARLMKAMTSGLWLVFLSHASRPPSFSPGRCAPARRVCSPGRCAPARRVVPRTIRHPQRHPRWPLGRAATTPLAADRRTGRSRWSLLILTGRR